MKFQQYHWAHLEKGAVVVVSLSVAANVRLMQPSDFAAYKAGRRHRYYGGLINRSPFRITVPETGQWYLTVDLAGLRASSVNIGVSVERSSLPVARPSSGSLEGIRAVSDKELSPDSSGRTWDVFISHAWEDKEAVARPLAAALERQGLSVWFDEKTLRIGDGLRRSIDDGLAHSRFGVVVMSKSFFSKAWPQYELDGIVELSHSGKQTMLPVWHDLTKDELLEVAPSLADRIARSTGTSTMDEIATEIAQVVRTP